jgi:hypothetical protein
LEEQLPGSDRGSDDCDDQKYQVSGDPPRWKMPDEAVVRHVAPVQMNEKSQSEPGQIQQTQDDYSAFPTQMPAFFFWSSAATSELI